MVKKEPMLAIFTGSKDLQKIKMSPKGGGHMLSNVLGIVIPGGPIGTGAENPAWPFCTTPVFAIFNLLF